MLSPRPATPDPAMSPSPAAAAYDAWYADYRAAVAEGGPIPNPDAYVRPRSAPAPAPPVAEPPPMGSVAAAAAIGFLHLVYLSALLSPALIFGLLLAAGLALLGWR